MLRTLRIGTAVLAATLSLTIALAQGPPAGGGPRFGRMLSRPDVQRDLKLTAAQKAKLETLMPRNRQPGAPRPDQKAIDAVLTDAQRKRLGEIRIQMAGPLAVLDPKVGAAVGLTAAQKAKIEALMPRRMGAGGPGGPPAGGRPGMGRPGAGQPGMGGMAGMRERMEGIRKQVEAVLTPAQRNKLKALGGKPFQRDKAPNRPGMPPRV